MPKNIKLIVYPVKDIKKATEFYGKFLGAKPYAESVYYVGFRIGDLEIGLDPNSEMGPIAYIDVDDIKNSINKMKEAGGEVLQEPKDVGGGLMIAQLKDPNGNVVGFRQK
jgi:predicted enzyme related to lactoylglutathione lyase